MTTALLQVEKDAKINFSTKQMSNSAQEYDCVAEFINNQDTF